MLNVSAAWQAASIAQFRYPAYLKCSISVVPPGIAEGATAASTTSYEKSSPSTILDEHTAAPQPLVTLEPNRWLLNGSFDIIEADTATVDWWAASSGTTALQFTFDSVYTIPGVYVEWDLVNNTFPSKVTFTGYNASHEAVATVEVTDINSSAGYISVPMDNIQYLDMTVDAWSFDGWVARVNSITFGFSTELDSINNGRINSAETTDTSSILSNELPKHAISITLRNYDMYLDPTRQQGLAKYLTEKQIATMQWGFTIAPGEVEWTDKLTYLVDSITIPSESREATLQFASRLDLLTSTFVEGNFTGAERSFKDVALYVLQRSGILKTSAAEQPWVLPDVLEQYTTGAPIPAQSTNSILQLIAGATATMLKTQAVTGYVQFKALESTPSEYAPITEAQSETDPTIEVAQPLKSITVSLYSYKAESTAKSVGTFKAALEGTRTLQVQYNVAYAQDVSATISGGTLASATYYASYAILVVVGTGAEMTVELTGKEVKQNVTYIQTYSDANIASGLNIKVDNLFVTNSDVLHLVSDAVESYYKLRNRSQVKYLGYPQLEVGDCIKLSSVYEQDLAVVVEQNNLSFNGGWSGTVEVV